MSPRLGYFCTGSFAVSSVMVTALPSGYCHMPIFLDSHHALELPIESIRQFLPGSRSVQASAQSPTTDSGVIPLDIYCGDNGRVVCVLAAPDEGAIRRHHAGQGISCRRIQRVPSSPGASGLTAPDVARVRHMIASDRGRHPSVMARRRLVG